MALVADKDKAHVKEMITSITDMVTKKILSLNITEEQLIDDAKGLVERVLLRIKSMPMMKHVDIDGIVEKIKGFISKTMQSKPSNTESNAESNVESRSNVDIDIDIANLKNDLKQHMSEFIKESSKMGPDVHNTFDVNNITKLLNEL
jgi:translation elongation factor EF-1beta